MTLSQPLCRSQAIFTITLDGNCTFQVECLIPLSKVYINFPIWNLGSPKFIYEFMKDMNLYINLKKSYEYIWIHIINIWIHWHIWNDYMNSYTCEFICEMNIWIHEYMNSCVWIQMYRFWILIWIHKYMNSDIRIHCIQSEFMILIPLSWIHCMNSLLKKGQNSIFWIHSIEFSSEIWHLEMNSIET